MKDLDKRRRSIGDYQRLIRKKLIFTLTLNLLIILISLIFHNRIIELFDSIPVYFIILGILLVFFIILLLYLGRVNTIIEFKEESEKLKIFRAIFRVVDYLGFTINIISCFYLVMFFVLTPANVRGVSMQPTFRDSDRVIIYHLTRNFQRENVVVINASSYVNSVNEPYFIKRIIGIPGDTIVFDSRELIINDIVIDGVTSMSQRVLDQLENGKIPTGYFLVLGDNRSNSVDSRTLGLISEEHIMGRVRLRFWPLSQLGFF
ncbi:MAG: signal peptidase I [Erysipelotrichales bacterium]|nr:signal peptidase I [Erysipelotrichales bacterium]